MSVNRNVTVPVGGLVICSAPYFLRPYYKASAPEVTTPRAPHPLLVATSSHAVPIGLTCRCDPVATKNIELGRATDRDACGRAKVLSLLAAGSLRHVLRI